MFDVSDERILACLAACQGVPTESLKTGLLAELLAALRDAREWVERCRSVLHDFGQHEDAIAAQVALDRIDCIMRDSQ